MIQSFFSIVAVVIFGACLSDISYALIVNITPARYYNCNTRYQTILYTIPNDNDAEEEITSDDSPIDIDKQKNALEGMLKNSGGESNTDTTIKNTSNILTSSRKMRLEREIELIKQLDPEHLDNNREYSDSQNQELVIQELWLLWYGERGRANEIELRKIEDTTVEQNQWPEAERRYLELIRKHCSIDGTVDNLELTNWVEPANRLATLLFMMGRLKESRKWCKRILNVKPWHIGALSGIAIVCMQMGDGEGVIKYSLMGLPNLSPEMSLPLALLDDDVEYAALVACFIVSNPSFLYFCEASLLLLLCCKCSYSYRKDDDEMIEVMGKIFLVHSSKQ